MKRAGIVLHGSRAEAAEMGRWLVERLGERGIQAEAARPDAARLGLESSERFGDGLDLIFALGGDGTLLRAAETAWRHDVPLLGVNLGRLGFLADVERGELSGALDRIVDDGFDVEERMVIEGEVAGRTPRPIWALNDAIIGKTTLGRAIKLGISIDGERFAALSADAVIVATPTGSTAYSFSAHGPIVSPAIDCLVVTPVSPHGLFDRSLVVSASETVTVHVYADPDPTVLSLDGRSEDPLEAGSDVVLRAGGRRLRLAKVGDVGFWRLVRRKFGLPGEPRDHGAT